MQAFDPGQSIHLTDQAVARIADLIEEEGNPNLRFRVFVTGGGCSGFQYGFSFDEDVAEDDTQIVSAIGQRRICTLLDAMSFPYLEGSEIDFINNLEGARFVVNNPNAQTTCGCGSSFAV
ncbi:MAG: iron-sulfur cluster insertion protein ErpA [Gammaproteobacteria bacterium AqS3]|nr:iron-sulfur cluster insertion protein ErpA [Gammaproteobacteria bacterium AqS3]